MDIVKPIYIITNNTNTIEILDIIFKINGYIGNIILALYLIPQLIKTIKTKSVDDISYIWQFLSLTGLGFVISYSIYFNLHPIYIPVGLEFFMVSLLIILKYHYTILNKKSNKLEIQLNSYFKQKKTSIKNLTINTNI